MFLLPEVGIRDTEPERFANQNFSIPIPMIVNIKSRILKFEIKIQNFSLEFEK